VFESLLCRARRRAEPVAMLNLAMDAGEENEEFLACLYGFQ
jgi:hypothetical protein